MPHRRAACTICAARWSGNPSVLAPGNATLIMSGDYASVEAARPVLEHVGSKLYHVGEQEQARVTKLAVNALVAANAQMLAEVVILCEASRVARVLGTGTR